MNKYDDDDDDDDGVCTQDLFFGDAAPLKCFHGLENETGFPSQRRAHQSLNGLPLRAFRVCR